MRNALIAIFLAVGILVAAMLLVEVANAIEPTTLDDALERPVKVEKYVDKENNVVCYWVGRYPEFINCVSLNDGMRKAK